MQMSSKNVSFENVTGDLIDRLQYPNFYYVDCTRKVLGGTFLNQNFRPIQHLELAHITFGSAFRSCT